MGISWKLAALAAFFVIAAAVAGCGSTVPGNSVASIAGNPVTLAAFNHWMYLEAKAQSNQYAQQGQVYPVLVANDPPKYASCISQIRTQVPSVASQKDTQLRSDCGQIFNQLTPSVMSFLIESYWYQADAHKLGIKYTNAQVLKQYQKIKNQQWPTAAAYDAFLQETGYTYQDILYQIRASELYSKLLKHWEKPVNAAAISAYFNAHKSQFGTPESRNLHLVRTKSQAEAQAALNALKSGQSWDAVAKQYAADASAKANGGLLEGITPGEEESAVSKAIFANAASKLVGPVKGIFGWYVLQTIKVTPATHESLAEATSAIKQQLTGQAQQSAQSKITAFSKKNWFSSTNCRSMYQTSDCANYKKPSTTTATTATPTNANTTSSKSSTKSTATKSTTTGS